MDLSTVKRRDTLVVRGQNPNYTKPDGTRVEGRRWTASVIVKKLLKSDHVWGVDTDFGPYSGADVLGPAGDPATQEAANEWERPAMTKDLALRILHSAVVNGDHIDDETMARIEKVLA